MIVFLLIKCCLNLQDRKSCFVENKLDENFLAKLTFRLNFWFILWFFLVAFPNIPLIFNLVYDSLRSNSRYLNSGLLRFCIWIFFISVLAKIFNFFDFYILTLFCTFLKLFWKNFTPFGYFSLFSHIFFLNFHPKFSTKPLILFCKFKNHDLIIKTYSF